MQGHTTLPRLGEKEPTFPAATLTGITVANEYPFRVPAGRLSSSDCHIQRAEARATTRRAHMSYGDPPLLQGGGGVTAADL
jgi:hypothetical protein